jgi:predicted dehydrogenase
VIRVAVIGYGFWGKNIARNLHDSTEFELVAVAESRSEQLDMAAAQYRHIECYQNAGVMLGDVRLDAVAITTPVSTHCELGRLAFGRWLHVLMAKPLTGSLREAEELAFIATAKNLTLLCDHTFVYHPVVTALREFIATGYLGDVWHVDSTRANLGTIRDDVDVLWDLAAHDISILMYLLGPIREVACTGADPLGTGQASVANLTCWMESGALATIGVSWLSPLKVRDFLVCGSQRMAHWDDVRPAERLRIFDHGITVDADEARVAYRTGSVESPRLDSREALAVECAHFAACIRGEEQPLTGPAAGVGVVRVLEAASRSLALDGARVEV